MTRGMASALAAVCLLATCVATTSAQAPPAQTPPATGKSTGTVAGKVVDGVTGDAIIEAGVEIVGTGAKTTTDLDGHFTLSVPAGTYDVRIFAPAYQSVRLSNVSVQPNKIARANAALSPAGKAGIEVVEVVAQADKAAEATQLLQRKKAAVVSDTISAETIAKSPDSSAAEIVQRAPAITIKDSKFIFVRGLGERYSSALLNGSRLPSTDPDKRVVPLDLFPAEFIESLGILKTYTPDLPGDFSGGLADIQLRAYPEKLTANFGLSTSGNTQATFQRFKTYKGGGVDYFGFDQNVRSLPKVLEHADRRDVEQSPRVEQFFGRSFKDVWSAESTTAPPNFGVNLSVGDRVGPLGFSLAGVYTTEYKQRPDEIVRDFVSGNPNPQDDFVDQSSVFETRLGGLFTAAYDLAPNHRLTFRSLYDRNTSDQTLTGRGVNKQGQIEENTLLEYIKDDLAYGQLAGEHRWSRLEIDWRSAFGRTTRDTPDRRLTVYQGGESTSGVRLSMTDDANGNTRTFYTLREYLTDSAVDFTIPFTTALPYTSLWSGLPAKFKFGPAYAYRTRNSDLRTFQFRLGPELVLQGVDRSRPPEEILRPENIAPGLVNFDENTVPRDSFSASQEIIAGYGMFDLPLIRERLRLIAGVRMEYSYIKVHAASQQGDPLEPRKNDLDPLPGLNLVYTPRADMNVRFGYSRAVSRPEFRELSPTVFPQPRGFRAIEGDPDLVQSSIESYDLRWEWFFSPLEIVSLSFFHKSIDKPIEQTLLDTGGTPRESFANAKDGSLIGFEFEGRKNFEFVSPALRNLSLLTNVAYIHSKVNVERGEFQSQSSISRTLQGQAPYVVNASLEYADPRWGTARLLYNTQGRRLSALGITAVPDIFEERRDQLDFVYLNHLDLFGAPVNVKLTAENLLNDRFLFTEGNDITNRYKTGVKVSLGFSYTY